MEKELEQTGIYILRNQINQDLIDRLLVSLETSFIKHREIQIKQGNEIDNFGVALNILPESEVYIELLEVLLKNNIISDIEKYYFKSKFIVNSFSGLDNKPNQQNFSALIHRDIKSYSANLPLMLNMLVMLDDFTTDNGSTLLLPNSHKKEEKPTDEYFKNNAISAIGKKGDILIFNSNIWHSSALNTTEKSRRAIPITLSKSFIKQLFDYPRSIGYDKINTFSDEMLQLLGYNSRVPSSLEEWYMPCSDRFYKKNQD
jgi:ectoine hydroxylase-related dioxygenase (phytanoyl-CoA dioxygenase family)